MKELIKKVQKYEIQIRHAVNSHMHGNFHSVFKGSGLEFSEVRSYQYGDDVRTIEWKVSAKGHGAFVKNFKEEKEQNVFFILDVSASQEIGADRQKIDIGKEICAVLTLSAIKEHAHVGIIGYSDQKELYIKPGKGLKHAYEIIFRIFDLKPKSLRTDLNKSLAFTLGFLKRKSVVILISDFIDSGFEQNLITLAKKTRFGSNSLIRQTGNRFPAHGYYTFIRQGKQENDLGKLFFSKISDEDKRYFQKK